MKPTNNWSTTQASTGSTQYPKIPVGGYGFTVLKAEAVESNGKEYINLYVDVSDNSDYNGHFMALLNRRKEAAERNHNPMPKYPCIYRCRTTDDEGNTSPRFKGLITTIEKSNPGFTWSWDEKALKGKKVGIVLREEEYDFNGNHGFAIKPYYVCKYSEAAAQPIPEKKLLDKKPNRNPFAVTAAPAMVEADDDDLPF